MSVVSEVLLALLRPAVTVGDGTAPDTTEERYAVLHMTPNRREAGDLTASVFDEVTQRFQVTSVGRTPRQVEWVADRTSGALLGIRPDVPGWSTGLIRGYDPEPISRDEDHPEDEVFFSTASYVFHASRA